MTRAPYSGDVTVEVTGAAGLDDVNISVAKPEISGRDDSNTEEVDATIFDDSE